MKHIGIFAFVMTACFSCLSAHAAGSSAAVQTLAQQSGLSKDEARKQFDMVFEAIKTELNAGNDITVQNFGRFYISELGPRKGRNPRTGEAIDIPARRYARFNSSESFKDVLNASEAKAASEPAVEAPKAEQVAEETVSPKAKGKKTKAKV